MKSRMLVQTNKLFALVERGNADESANAMKTIHALMAAMKVELNAGGSGREQAKLGAV
ncbi:hypothetical protein [Aeromonas popoffii]|uniref:hypothetical protein n=1 Tax=Aeromonas popoffii TaxID=70856 RepID=UPI0012ED6DFA|nr:hypothetical protein [Aeromonas popoffii]